MDNFMLIYAFSKSDEGGQIHLQRQLTKNAQD